MQTLKMGRSEKIKGVTKWRNSDKILRKKEEVKYNMINVLSDVSEETIQGQLQKQLGLPSHHAARKPLINEKMCKKHFILQKVQTL